MSDNDLHIISLARSKDVLDAGWEQLANRCESPEAIQQIRIIEHIKWTRHEYCSER